MAIGGEAQFKKVTEHLINDNKALRDLVDWQAAENQRLREVLREIAEGDRPDNDKQFCVGYWGATARAALEEGKE